MRLASIFWINELSIQSVMLYAGEFLVLLLLIVLWNRQLYREIKARIAAEKALRESESKLRAILNADPECIKVTDENGYLLQMNQAGLTLLEADDPSSVIGKKVETFVLPEYHASFRDMNAAVLAGTSCSLVFQIKGLKGTRRWMETQAVPLLDNDSGKMHILSVTHDITRRKRAEQRDALRNAMLDLLSTDAPLPEILTAIIRTVEADNPNLLGCILLVNNKEKQRVTHIAPSIPGFSSMDGEIENKVYWAAIFKNTRLIAATIETHPQWQYYRHIAQQAKLVACWSEPIQDHQGQLFGIFTLYPQQPAVPNDDDVQLLLQTASTCAIAIERYRLHEEQKLACLVYQNSSEAMTVTDANGVILTVNPAFTHLTGYTAVEVVGKSTRLLSSGKQSESFYQAMWHRINGTGHWQGEILNRRKNGEVYTEWLTINSIFNPDGTVNRRVALFSDISHKKESEYLIWKQANFDLLTNLPNRRMFQDRLEQEIKKSCRENLPLALLIIDLDRFKEVNETLGHDMGDQLLKEAAQRLSGCVGETDTVARLGGDEFTVILTSLQVLGFVDSIAETILQQMLIPFHLNQRLFYISASIGIAIYPDDAVDAGELLRSADQAMYAAKSQGRNRYSYFAVTMQEAAKERMLIATDLRNALIDNQFKVFYQPIVELKTGRVRKAEALIRWQHPKQGLVSPAAFIPIAEETDMILKIGTWVFKQTAAQVLEWRTLYDADFQVSVNKSPMQFKSVQTDHKAWLAHLKEIGLAGAGIVVEITEGLLMDTNSTVMAQLFALQQAGVQISLDDFGTGYSSLSYLKKFNIDYLKIDQSFVRNMQANSNDLVLCEAIIVMAHKLGIQVVAEGIETAEQRDLLAAAGCDYGQGYLFSHPVPAVEFERILAVQSNTLPPFSKGD